MTIDQGDWDMHTDIGTVEWGGLRRNAEALALAVAAFFDDLGPLADKVTLVAVSEFGRRVQENENYGTDHGYGNAMFVVGGGVSGGYKGTWPGLVNDYDADVLVTTDYRSVLAEVVLGALRREHGRGVPGLHPRRVWGRWSGSDAARQLSSSDGSGTSAGVAVLDLGVDAQVVERTGDDVDRDRGGVRAVGACRR